MHGEGTEQSVLWLIKIAPLQRLGDSGTGGTPTPETEGWLPCLAVPTKRSRTSTCPTEPTRCARQDLQKKSLL